MCIELHQKVCRTCDSSEKQVGLSKNILQSIQSGQNFSKINLLYDKPLKKLKKYILINGGNQDEIDDIFQDCLIALLTKRSEEIFNNFQYLENFLFVVGKNLWINKVRRDKRIISLEPLKLQNKFLEDKNQLTEIISSEKTTFFYEIFEKLDEKCKDVLEDRMVDGLSMEEISLKRGYKNLNVVKNKHARCKKYMFRLILQNPELYKQLRY